MKLEYYCVYVSTVCMSFVKFVWNAKLKSISLPHKHSPIQKFEDSTYTSQYINVTILSCTNLMYAVQLKQSITPKTQRTNSVLP